MIIPKPNKIEYLDEPSYLLKKGTNPLESIRTYTFDGALKSEEYTLKVTSSGAEITYGDNLGLERAKATLTALATLGKGEIKAVKIEDSPRIPMRVYMMDVGRYFFSKEEIFKQIDYIALYKFNYLHLHLTEDQGWRVEIKKYPKLTEIGSRRYRTHVRLKEHKGYYTQEELKEIVAYAHSKGIKVIPEIDVPGHFQSALASYPELGCFGRKVKVAENFGIKFDVACIGKENTVNFIKDVITELAEIFTDEYFHVGGDEVPSERWKLCPDCKKKYESLGCKNYAEYQAHFTNELAEHVISLGKTPIAWNESDPTGLVDERVVWCAWDIDYDNPKFKAELERGRKVINAKTEPYYLDLPYGINSLERVYDYEADVLGENLLGAELCLWTELVPDVKTARKKAFPRLLAGAERLWSVDKDYSDFERRLGEQGEILRDFDVKPTPKWKYNPGAVVTFFSKLWWARRQLYWAGLENIITNAIVKAKAK